MLTWRYVEASKIDVCIHNTILEFRVLDICAKLRRGDSRRVLFFFFKLIAFGFLNANLVVLEPIFLSRELRNIFGFHLTCLHVHVHWRWCNRKKTTREPNSSAIQCRVENQLALYHWIFFHFFKAKLHKKINAAWALVREPYTVSNCMFTTRSWTLPTYIL
jgi:hypothetical protein